jgi:hypothetical protein
MYKSVRISFVNYEFEKSERKLLETNLRYFPNIRLQRNE